MPSPILHYEDEYITNILSNTHSIAVVGLSNNENRPSYFAASYLQSKGYKIIPVNPNLKGKKVLNEKSFSSLDELNITPDMVDIFLKNEFVIPEVIKAVKLATKTIWLQLGIINHAAQKLAKKAKINFVMNRCPKIEYARLSGELSWAGINTNIISNKKLVFKR